MISWLKKILSILRPIEILGLFFLFVMVILYQWFDLELFSIHRILLWTYTTFFVFIIIFIARLLVDLNIKKVFAPKEILGFMRDWIPLVIFILVYDNLHDITSLINPLNFDPFFITVDKILFFGHHPTLVFEKFISPLATQWLGFVYALYFLFFPVTLGVLYFQGKRKEFHITSLSVMLAIYTGFILYLLFPCVGPILAQNNIHTVDLQGDGTFSLYNGAVALYGEYRNYFHCFPSLHFAVTAIFWWFSWKYSRPLFWIYLPIVLSLWFSTVYLRWHYVVDILAGAVIAGYAIFIGPQIQHAWENWSKKQRT